MKTYRKRFLVNTGVNNCKVVVRLESERDSIVSSMKYIGDGRHEYFGNILQDTDYLVSFDIYSSSDDKKPSDTIKRRLKAHSEKSLEKCSCLMCIEVDDLGI